MFLFSLYSVFSIKINYFLDNSLTLGFKNIWQQLVAQEHSVKSTFNLFAILQSKRLSRLGHTFSAKLQILFKCQEQQCSLCISKFAFTIKPVSFKIN